MNSPSFLTIAGFLVVIAGTCAMTDAALARISPNRSAELQREGVRGAGSLLAVSRDLAAYINLLLLLRLACELTATVLVALVAVDRWGFGWLAGVISAGAMTVISFVLVGVGPRTIGRQHPYRVGLLMAGVIRALGKGFGPLTRLLIILGNALTPGKGYREGPFATEVELRDLVDLAEQRGDVETGEREMIHSVFELGDTIAREVMVPRTDVVWIEHDKTAQQALTLALRSGFSRIPVIGDSIDDVVGVVYLKDIARLLHIDTSDEAQAAKTAVSALMRDPEFVPESKPIDELLREMQARRIHMAIVIDEYGGTAGLVTIEDIVEEIVGEITDEYDNERPPIERLDDNTVRVTARLSVEDLSEVFQVTLPNGDIETVGGLLAQSLGKVPIPGAKVTVSGLELTAESIGGRRNRIDTVLVTQTPAHQRR